MAYKWVRMVNSGVVSLTPGFIGSVIVTPDSDDDRATATFYDGESSGDPQILKVRTAAGVTHVTRFQPPLVIHRGFYADLTDHVEEILIQYHTEAE